MDTTKEYSLFPVGVVHSTIANREEAPNQGTEGAPEALLEIYPDYKEAIDGILAGNEIVLITWLHKSARDVLRVHPRYDPKNPLSGVFTTRAPDRPNPIGLHCVKVLEVIGSNRLKVHPLEAIDGTPIIDIKPVLANCDNT